MPRLGQARRRALRLRAGGLMRLVFTAYLVVIATGLILYLVIGLLDL